MRKYLAIAAAGLLGACVSVPSLENFPDRNPANGAVLLRLTTKGDVPYDFFLNQYNIRIWNKAGGAKKLAAAYHILGPMPKATDDLYLLEVPPGRYYVDMTAGVRRKEIHFFPLDRPRGAFGDVVVRAGEVVPAGLLSIDVKIDILAVRNDEDDTVDYKTNDKILTWDDSVAARRAIVDAALQDRRSSADWKEPLKAARASLGP